MVRKSPSVVIASYTGLAILALGAAAYLPRLIRQNAEPVRIAEVTTTGKVSLALTPATASLAPNATLDLTLSINAGQALATGTTTVITYDPTFLTAQSVTRGDFFGNELEAATISNGRISFTYVVPPSSGGKAGTGSVATLRFKALKSGSTTVNFGNETIATVIGDDANSLKSVAGATLAIRGRSDIYPAGGDGVVNLLDFNALVANFGKGATPADINNSGTTDLLDYNLLVADYGKTY